MRRALNFFIMWSLTWKKIREISIGEKEVRRHDNFKSIMQELSKLKCMQFKNGNTTQRDNIMQCYSWKFAGELESQGFTGRACYQYRNMDSSQT